MLTACGEHEMTGELTARDDTDRLTSRRKPSPIYKFGEKSALAPRFAELNITDLWLFDYMGDELKQTIHKTDGFDAAALSLDYGEHTLCFVASRGSEPTVTAPTISWVKPSDTFWATLFAECNNPHSSGLAIRCHAHRVATRLAHLHHR